MHTHAMAAMTRGAALTPFETDTPPLGAHDCVVKVLRCGLCHSDVHMVDDDWRISTYPLVPGHEVIGEVVERGREVRHLKTGDRVGIGWQRSACLQCPDCLRGDENLCNENNGVIVDGQGGFASHLSMDSRFCFTVPAGIPTDTGGPLLCGGVTVYSALRCAGMTSGKEVGVIGVGGLGHLAVQFAARLGNHVTVFTTSDDKAQLAARLGAHEFVVTRTGQPLRTKRPLDVLISTVPHDLDWNGYINLLGSDGTLTFVAVPPKPLSLSPGLLLGKRRRVMASPIGGRATMTDMLRVADTFGVEPIVEHFPLSQVNEAMKKVRDNTVRFRAVLTP